MDQARKNAIALAIVAELALQKGSRKSVSFDPDIKRQLGNKAKSIGVKAEELMDFLRPVARTVLNKSLGINVVVIHEKTAKNGEIAYKILKFWIKTGEVPISPKLQEQIEDFTEKSKIDKAEIREVISEICEDLFLRTYGN